jgi:hypothetical protein
MIPEKEFFDPKQAEKLLVIGFEVKPKGIHPLVKRKSTMN